MQWSHLNLIHVLSWYFLTALIVSTVLRWRNYRHMLGLIVAFPQRWPKLLDLVKQHREVFWQWPTILPVGCTLVLILTHLLASFFIWSQARVTPHDLVEHMLSGMIIILCGTLMFMFDGRLIFQVTHFDRLALESDFDKAERWLGSWKTPAVRFLTLGLVNPQKIVNAQVRDALLKANEIVNGQLWLWAFQFAIRFALGLTIWLTWIVNLQQQNVQAVP
jgi:hypothetical protein